MVARKEAGLEAYFYDVNRYTLLTREEEVMLARRIRDHGDREARDRLIASNLRLVVSLARRHVGRGLPFLDIIEEGNVGLTKAVDHFDPEAGCRFATYATWWIRQSIRKALSDHSRPVRIPSYLSPKIAAWKRKASDMREETNQEPSLREVATACGVTRRNFPIFQSALLTLRSTSQMVSLDNGDNGSIGQNVPDPQKDSPADELLKRLDISRMLRYLDRLPDRSRKILAMRFGLDGEEPLTLREIGDRVGLSRERVRQIEAEALVQLRRWMEPDEVAA